MNDGIEIERDETSDECNTMLRVSESRVDMTQRRATRHNDEAKYKTRKCHFANLLSHRSVKDSFNRKLTTIVLSGVTKSDAGSWRSVLKGIETRKIEVSGLERLRVT